MNGEISRYYETARQLQAQEVPNFFRNQNFLIISINLSTRTREDLKCSQ